MQFATSEPATGYAPVGTYTITPSGLTSPNYSDQLRGGRSDRQPGGADGDGKRRHQHLWRPIPSFSYTLSGFVAGEDATIAGVTGSPILSTPATQSSGAGTYTITVAAGTLAAANYDFPNLVNGTLTITPAPLTITADNQITVYGAPLPRARRPRIPASSTETHRPT